ncbi:hypothetical protein LCGC14_1568070 [marine sediment metagenome]|uniref:Uncharacterized protein n=1 Tax=marine sediment metagenome TaxID=412755 RepID=A0A0F9LL34_9ZZZZ
MKKLAALIVAVAVTVSLGLSSLASANGQPNCTGNQNCSPTDNSVNNTANGGSATANGGAGGAGGSATGGNAVVGDTSANSTVGNVTSGASSSTGGVNQSQNIEGDDVQVYGHSSAPAAEGTSSVSLGTLVGGISVAHTEAYVKIRGHIAELVVLHNAGLVGDDGVLTEAEWTDDYRKSIKRLSRVSRRGERTLMNLFGIIR